LMLIFLGAILVKNVNFTFSNFFEILK